MCFTPAIAQHAAVHYSASLSAPTAALSRLQRREAPKRPSAVHSFLMFEDMNGSMIWRREFEKTHIDMHEKRLEVSSNFLPWNNPFRVRIFLFVFSHAHSGFSRPSLLPSFLLCTRPPVEFLTHLSELR